MTAGMGEQPLLPTAWACYPFQLTEQYIQTYGLEARLLYSAGRGFYLSLPSTELLPSIFIQAVMHKRTVACTTVELQSLSDRATECINQALISTNQLIQGLVQDIRRGLESLYALVDDVVGTHACWDKPILSSKCGHSR